MSEYSFPSSKQSPIKLIPVDRNLDSIEFFNIKSELELTNHFVISRTFIKVRTTKHAMKLIVPKNWKLLYATVH